MYRFTIPSWVTGLLTTLALASQGAAQEPASVTENALRLQNAIEVQTRGPIHEAFAQPTQTAPEPGPVIPKQPPAPISEEPAEQSPAENAQWIPGYWAWDAERQEFIWVSGTYRISPQGRTFVPGYFTQTDQGWRWVPGFWVSQRQ